MPAEALQKLVGQARPVISRLQVLVVVRQDGIERVKQGSSSERPLDEGIKHAVILLQQNGVETFESCEGGVGHAFPEPTIRFHGDSSEGFRALAVAQKNGLRVDQLRRYYQVQDGEPTGPYWELTLVKG